MASSNGLVAVFLNFILIYKTRIPPRTQSIVFIGTEGGTRTPTIFLPTDFKSVASSIPPHLHIDKDDLKIIIILIILTLNIIKVFNTIF